MVRGNNPDGEPRAQLTRVIVANLLDVELAG